MDLIYLSLSFGPMLFTAFCLYRWFLAPRLNELPPDVALQVLVSVHCLRFVSPISLVAGVTVPGLSAEFTMPQVVGDMSTALFALIAISLLRSGSRHAVPWLWFVNLFGLVDLLIVAIQGVRHEFAAHVGGMFYIAVWFVPCLLVSHSALFTRLRRLGARQVENGSA
ncbi:MAG: hypothetical protein ABI605_02925 [Rhizobacter sp.]